MLLLPTPKADDKKDQQVLQVQGELVQLDGATVLPGLQDAHLHVAILGERAERIDLSQCRSIAEIQQKLREGARTCPKGTWCIGFDWDHEKLAEERAPTREELDAVSRDHAVFAFRVCVHVGVGNTMALERCGVPLDRPGRLLDVLPPSVRPADEETAAGLIEYDPTTGTATGMLKEHMCYHVEELQRNSATFEQRRARIQRGIRQCLQQGLTAVQPNDALAWDVYSALHADGDLPIRVHLTVPFDELGNPASHAPARPQAKRDDMLRCQRIKACSHRER